MLSAVYNYPMVVITTRKEIAKRSMLTKKKPLTQKALSVLGGTATLKKHGVKHYKKMALARHHPEEYAKKYGGK